MVGTEDLVLKLQGSAVGTFVRYIIPYRPPPKPGISKYSIKFPAKAAATRPRRRDAIRSVRRDAMRSEVTRRCETLRDATWWVEMRRIAIWRVEMRRDETQHDTYAARRDATPCNTTRHCTRQRDAMQCDPTRCEATWRDAIRLGMTRRAATQHDVTRWHTTRRDAKQYYATLHDAKRHTTRCDATRCNVTRRSAMRHDVTRRYTMRRNTARCDATRHETTQYDAKRRDDSTLIKSRINREHDRRILYDSARFSRTGASLGNATLKTKTSERSVFLGKSAIFAYSQGRARFRVNVRLLRWRAQVTP